MSKRKVTAADWRVIKRELEFMKTNGVLEVDKINEIERIYEPKRVSFTKTLLYVGAILIGVGILSFVASNWAEIGKLTKFLMIIGLFIACFFTGYKMESTLPKTAKSFYYLGAIVFGAGIFLVGQMFHFGGDFQDAFLWWSLGIMPLAWVIRDKRLLLGAGILILVSMTDATIFNGEVIPYWILLWIVSIWWLNNKIGFSAPNGFIHGLLQLAFIASILNYFLHDVQDTEYIYGLVFLLIGMGLVLMEGKIRDIYVSLGFLVHGVAALLLSLEETWPNEWVYLPFSFLYVVYLFYYIKKGSLFSIVLLCMMIFRFYLDYTFAFLPKSLVFIIGGIILLGFGFYFEKQRKKGRNHHA
ncbi:DUF2157 domain-containing protein [Mesobacillus maritimus]|uniref:DUF2157 domain-containing protein n=1 Tax=Mesobacillus maritimus TaxID=1643336 RepID=UPI0020424F98|nr:DUF2157 domain-containing protein [Mesobacillus maritimus]MCM3585611.1 DUF2157 domain-containing protein [Mesobacillus maritimus]MCM3669083.1 DUF2157 domain-containing protein [Mesobacillus maritimus]